MQLRKLIILLVCLLGMSVMQAQNVLFFNSKQGLSNSCIHSICEDSRHNIWITTQNGLNRYDGLKINAYRHDDMDSTSLCHDDVIVVYEYDRNHLLVGTGNGVQVYDYATDKFKTIPFLGFNGDTLSVRVDAFCKIKEGKKERLIMCFSGYGCGEVSYDAKTGFSIKQISDYNIDNVSPRLFIQDKKGHTWVKSDRGDVYIKHGKSYKKYTELSGVVKMVFGTTGQLYAATDNHGIFAYDAKHDNFTCVAPFSSLAGVVYSINPWMDGKMLISTDGGGLRVYNEKTGEVTQSTIKVNDFNIATSNVKDALMDSYGNVWVGIYWKGVMMKPNFQSCFEYVGRHSITKNTIGTNSVFSITKADAGHLYVAIDNDGLYCMSSDGTSSKHWSKESMPNLPSAFTYVYNMGSGKALLGTFFDGLWEKNGDSFSLVTKDINRIFEIQPAADGCLWIATVGQGIYYYNPSTKQFLHYSMDAGSSAVDRVITVNPFVYCVKSINGYLYAGTADGLFINKVSGNGIIEKQSKILLRMSAVKHLALSKDKKTLWVGTNKGLYKFDVATLKYKRYSERNGLPNSSIESLCVDGNKLWISTDNGLSCMNIAKETFNNFFADDGLQDNEFSRGAILMDGHNLYVGGISGITYFNTHAVNRRMLEDRKLDLHFVDVIVGGKVMHKGDKSDGYDVLQGVLNDIPVVELSNSDNHFTLELCVGGISNQHVTYEYSIDGGHWLSQGEGNNRLVFDNLKARTYNIKVRAVVLGSVSSERELTVIVHPAWYASWWAICIYIILFIAICWLLTQYTRRQIKARKVIERHRHEQELNEARVQFFMNISHEIRTPMTLILAPLEKLMGMDTDEVHQHNYELIKHNSNRILRLVNQMMDVRKIEQGKFLLDYHEVEIVSFVKNIYDVFVTNAQNRNITYEYQHDVETLKVFVDPDNMDKIVMNLLSNAFKFTSNGGKIVVSLSATDADGNGGFSIQVTDNGSGIKDEDKSKVFERFYSANHQNGYIGTGIGLNLTYMLVRLHKGTIAVSDNPDEHGTRFVVHIPVGDESLLTFKPETKVAEPSEEVQSAAPLDMSGGDKISDGTKKNVILVEDDEAIREYVQSELNSDFAITEFGNGQQAWDYIINHPNKVDLVISDIMMPVMDGLTLCQKLKSNFITNHIAIILMTALGSDADRIAGITNGADAYVSKPFNIDVLRTTALGLIRNRMLVSSKLNGDKQQEELINHIEMESPDEHLMKRIMKVISDNMDNPDLSVEMIADQVGISRVHFYRKMKDLTGQAPRDYIKYVRLKEAARLLKNSKTDITGVSIATGFKSLSSFSTNFKSLYGISPSEWIKKQAEGGE